MTKLHGLDSFIEVAEEHEQHKSDMTLTPAQMGFQVLTDQDGTNPKTHLIARTEYGTSPFSLNTRPVNQTLRRIQQRKSSPVNYSGPMPVARHIVHDMYPGTQAMHLNQMLATLPNNKYLVRGYGDEWVSSYSEMYHIADPVHLIDAMKRGFEHVGRVPPVSGYVTRYGLSMRVVYPEITRDFNEGDGGDVPYSAGFVLKTSKTSSHILAPFIQRGPCENTTMFYSSEWGFKLQHRYDQRFVTEFLYANMRNVMDQSEELMNKVEDASLDALDNFSDIIAGISKKAGLDKRLEHEFFATAQQQGGHTRLGVANGLSWIAQDSGIKSLDAREELEALSGFVMAGGQNYSAYLNSVRSDWNSD